MYNFYETIKGHLHFNNMVFVEYWIGLNETNSDVHMYTLIIYFIH